MFFRKPKLHISALQYEPNSWLMDTSNDLERRWQCRDYRAILQLNYIPTKPDLPKGGMNNLILLQNFFRTAALKSNGGILLTEIVEIDNIRGIKNILKAPQALGMRYMGAYLFPFKNCSFGVKFITEEFEQIGLRESLIAAEFFDGMDIPVNQTEKLEEGWYKDPYQSTFKKGTPMSIAERAEYDTRFPEHPLTKLRTWMEELEQNLTFDEKVHKLKPF
mgnify:CR=1 FL=1